MLRDNIKPFIPRIISRELTNREVARALGASEEWVCRTLKALGVVREPAPDRSKSGTLLTARRELRTRLANDPTLTLEEAARQAHCTVRTIYRYRNKQ